MANIVNFRSISRPESPQATLELMESTRRTVRACHHQVARRSIPQTLKNKLARCRQAIVRIQSNLAGVTDENMQRDFRILHRDYECVVNRVACARMNQTQLCMNQVNANLRLSLEYARHKTGAAAKVTRRQTDKIGNRLFGIGRRLRHVKHESLQKQYGLLFYRYQALVARLPSEGSTDNYFSIINPSYETAESELDITFNEDLATQEEKTVFLQTYLEEFCDKGNLKGVEWVIRNHRESGLQPLQLMRPLEVAILGGYEEVVHTLCRWVGPRTLRDLRASPGKESGHFLPVPQYGNPMSLLTALCVEMGYPHLLPVLEKYGFPVSEAEKRAMRELAITQERFARFISFPQPLNTDHSEARGGDANKHIRESEYKRMVGYAIHYLQKGGSHRTLIENLLHRRRRMAVLTKLLHLDLYGRPTDCVMDTSLVEQPYGECGERIRAKYPNGPVRAAVPINGRRIPLTTITHKMWYHSNGRHRDVVLNEVDRWCASHFHSPRTDTEIAYALHRPIFLLSHMPPSCRGTPIVLRAFVDALCLLQQRMPIDPKYEINCDALYYKNIEEFVKDFTGKVSFPIPV